MGTEVFSRVPWARGRPVWHLFGETAHTPLGVNRTAGGLLQEPLVFIFRLSFFQPLEEDLGELPAGDRRKSLF